MANLELLEQWRITEEWLQNARDRLNVDANCNPEHLARFNQYLLANELELALCELEAASETKVQGHQFWDSMIQAAGSMGLKVKCDEFSKKWAELRNVPR